MSDDYASNFVRELGARNTLNQTGHNVASDSNLDELLQAFALQDTDIKYILTGKLQEPLNEIQKIISEHATNQCIGNEVFLEITGLLRNINVQLAHYKRMVPYLFTLSPVVRLSNLTAKDAMAFSRRVDLMITRDQISLMDDDNSLLSDNFWDGLRMVNRSNFASAVNGWAMQQLAESKSTVRTIVDSPRAQRKKILGVF